MWQQEYWADNLVMVTTSADPHQMQQMQEPLLSEFPARKCWLPALLRMTALRIVLLPLLVDLASCCCCYRPATDVYFHKSLHVLRGSPQRAESNVCAFASGRCARRGSHFCGARMLLCHVSGRPDTVVDGKSYVC